jgi:hypothetical protein
LSARKSPQEGEAKSSPSDDLIPEAHEDDQVDLFDNEQFARAASGVDFTEADRMRLRSNLILQLPMSVGFRFFFVEAPLPVLMISASTTRIPAKFLALIWLDTNAANSRAFSNQCPGFIHVSENSSLMNRGPGSVR